MKISKYLLPTQKEVPNDAEIISNQLMLRAGMIRKLASGLYTWMPLGFKVLQKVEKIVCKHMNAFGAMQMLMPSIQPAELWKETKRWDDFGDELLRIKDRHKRQFVVGPTHEEVITNIIRDEIQSYKQLPINLYQVQNKFRDERRPRFGIMRCREFLMKDAYSFHVNSECLNETYLNMRAAYVKIFDELAVKYRIVEADNGAIGGNKSEEFHVLANSGEDQLAICNNNNYAVNIEKAEAQAVTNGSETQDRQPLETFHTPDIKTIEQLTTKFDIDIKNTVKTLIVAACENSKHKFIALVIRGDHQLNELKAAKLNAINPKLRFASNEEVSNEFGASTGYLGPVHCPIPVIVDHSVANMRNFYAGANSDGYHFKGVNWGRDCHYTQVADLRNAIEGDLIPGTKESITITRGIEVGHIFQLGTKYSESMKARVIDTNGKSVPLNMGCYGIGISRIVAAVIEQNNDSKGIIWPESIAPFQVLIVAIKYKSDVVKQQADKIYQQFLDANIEVLFDDRNISPGIKFAEAELIGVPHCLIISERNLKNNEIEYKNRANNEKNCKLPLDTVFDFINKNTLTSSHS